MLTNTLITYCSFFLSITNGREIRKFLNSSPVYPSLVSVIQTLQHVGMDAHAGQCDWQYLKNFISPILIHLKIGDKESLIIAKWDINNYGLKILNLQNKQWYIKYQNDLVNVWDGVVIYANNQPINNQYRNYFKIFLYVFILIFLIILLKTKVSFLNALYYAPLFLGFVISCNRYFKSGISNHGIIDKLCYVSKFTDCESVEYSKFSKVFGFEMKCLSLSFFVAQLFCLIAGYILMIPNVLCTLYFISAIIALPTIVYSIYGQVKIHVFCPLCILIIVCLTIEAILFWIEIYPTINSSVLILNFSVFIISIAILQHISYIKNKERSLFNESINLLRLKRKNEIFLLESIATIPIISPLQFGNEKSSFTITTLISPSCMHCRGLVSEIIDLQKKGLNFCWKLILGEIKPSDSEKIEIWISKFLIDRDSFYNNLILWSKYGYPISFSSSKNFNNNSECNKIRNLFNDQINQLKLTGFPQIIFNERLLSSIYSVKDLYFLIVDQVLNNDIIRNRESGIETT